MLDCEVAKEFFEIQFEDCGMDVTKDIKFVEHVETFSHYTESDYYEWLKDNFNSLFFCFNEADAIGIMLERE